VITESGLSRLENDSLAPILRDLGFDPYQGVLESWNYESSSEIQLDSLPPEFLPFKGTFLELAEFMNSLLRGLNVQAPRPRAHV